MHVLTKLPYYEDPIGQSALLTLIGSSICTISSKSHLFNRRCNEHRTLTVQSRCPLLNYHSFPMHKGRRKEHIASKHYVKIFWEMQTHTLGNSETEITLKRGQLEHLYSFLKTYNAELKGNSGKKCKVTGNFFILKSRPEYFWILQRSGRSNEFLSFLKNGNLRMWTSEKLYMQKKFEFSSTIAALSAFLKYFKFVT